jgi:hypothetical protein
MSVHVLLTLAVNSKSERKVNSLPQLGFQPVIFRMLAHLSDHSAKAHLSNLISFTDIFVLTNFQRILVVAVCEYVFICHCKIITTKTTEIFELHRNNNGTATSGLSAKRLYTET